MISDARTRFFHNGIFKKNNNYVISRRIYQISWPISTDWRIGKWYAIHLTNRNPGHNEFDYPARHESVQEPCVFHLHRRHRARCRRPSFHSAILYNGCPDSQEIFRPLFKPHCYAPLETPVTTLHISLLPWTTPSLATALFVNFRIWNHRLARLRNSRRAGSLIVTLSQCEGTLIS